MNLLRCCDNLELMRSLESDSIDLIYIDPPYFSQKNFGEFDDRWESMQDYLDFMVVRLREMKRLLKPTGSIYVHLDWHASHYVKVEMDKIFGVDNFQNEIVWHYRRWTSPSQRFQRLHDVVLFYSKTHKYYFNRLLTSYTHGSIQRKEQGVLHRFKNGKHVLVSNRIVQAAGVPENDVWHIPFVAPSAKERIGYPTQKPESLLERIIMASSKEGDTIADFFCGSGVIPAVAQRLKRHWIACDISQKAIEITESRIAKSKFNGNSITQSALEL